VFLQCPFIQRPQQRWWDIPTQQQSSFDAFSSSLVLSLAAFAEPWCSRLEQDVQPAARTQKMMQSHCIHVLAAPW